MAAVAQEAGLSLRNLSRLFLDQIGLSPKQAPTHYRIAAARDFLLTGSTVSEAAHATGYVSLTQFITMFRRLTGQRPSQVIHLGRNVETWPIPENSMSHGRRL
jgi:AraC-like DNA-binding protein